MYYVHWSLQGLHSYLKGYSYTKKAIALRNKETASLSFCVSFLREGQLYFMYLLPYASTAMITHFLMLSYVKSFTETCTTSKYKRMPESAHFEPQKKFGQ